MEKGTRGREHRKRVRGLLHDVSAGIFALQDTGNQIRAYGAHWLQDPGCNRHTHRFWILDFPEIHRHPASINFLEVSTGLPVIISLERRYQTREQGVF